MFRLIFILILVSILSAQNSDLETWYEKSGFKETPRYKETVEYCKKLDTTSPFIHFTNFGKSPQGRDLPLLIVDKNANFTSGQVRNTDNVVFFIQACIHAGESDGKDAGLMLIRDIITNPKLLSLLDHVTLLFNPIFNVDGHERFGAYNRANQNGPEEMGWRTTAQNLNLNRDYLKADAPEMQNWLMLYSEWLPEFFADCHVTDGADYQYAVTYAIEKDDVIDPELGNWIGESYLPPLKKSMADAGFPIIQYITFRKNHDMQSGLVSWIPSPRFSNGYTAIQNRPGLLIETHMFKDYKTRVTSTYEILKNTIEILNKEYLTLKEDIAKADQRTSSPSFRSETLPLTYKYTNMCDTVDFLGYEYDVTKSDLTGGDWYRYHEDKPKTYRLPFFHSMVPDVKVKLPEAYIIPVEWTEVIDRIKLHGIQFTTLQKEQKVKISSYKFSEVEWSKTPYENRQTVKFQVTPVEEERIFPKGSVLIDMNQRAAKVIAGILEPQAPDSYVQWGFFNSIFERKEYVESYVMEERARMMLAADPQLEEEFETKLNTDSSFVNNQRAILNWFYQKSPYWDTQKDIYPVGRIFDRDLVNRLK
jgi:murein tripeptide amidase MpaA